MKVTEALHAMGQSLWLDNITRRLLNEGALQRYIDDYSVTGLTSNPTIFDVAIEAGSDYDEDIAKLKAKGLSAEAVFFELAIADLQRGADLFLEVHRNTGGVDGWVSLEVSPLLVHSTEETTAAADELHRRANRDNLFVKIPGTVDGLPSIEASIFAGIPINVTLLFSTEQYLAASDAYLRGIERRVQAGLDPAVGSVASLFVSRWDSAILGNVPTELSNRLGIAVAKRTYRAYCERLSSERWKRLEHEGALVQRLLWASTSTKNPDAKDTLYVEALAAENTVNTMPEKTLLAFADHGTVGEPLPKDGGDADAALEEFKRAGVDVSSLAAKLQNEGAESFAASWRNLIACIAAKSERLAS